MEPTNDKIRCGDVDHCANCQLREILSQNGAQTPIFTLNAMGRCDFYNGPSHVLREMRG